MSSRDESLPLRDVPPGQIAEAQAAAAAAEEAAIEKRLAEARAAWARDHDFGPPHELADIAWLLAALRKERAKVERLRAALEPFVKEKAAALMLDATRELLSAPPGPRVTVDRSRPPAEGIRFTIEAPPGTLDADVPPPAERLADLAQTCRLVLLLLEPQGGHLAPGPR